MSNAVNLGRPFSDRSNATGIQPYAPGMDEALAKRLQASPLFSIPDIIKRTQPALANAQQPIQNAHIVNRAPIEPLIQEFTLMNLASLATERFPKLPIQSSDSK